MALRVVSVAQATQYYNNRYEQPVNTIPLTLVSDQSVVHEMTHDSHWLHILCHCGLNSVVVL